MPNENVPKYRVVVKGPVPEIPVVQKSEPINPIVEPIVKPIQDYEPPRSRRCYSIMYEEEHKKVKSLRFFMIAFLLLSVFLFLGWFYAEDYMPDYDELLNAYNQVVAERDELQKTCEMLSEIAYGK